MLHKDKALYYDHYLSLSLSPPPSETHNVTANRMTKTPSILASITYSQITSLMFIWFPSTRHNKNITGGSQICQVLNSTPSSLPCPRTQEHHIKGTIPLGSLVGGAFLAQAYKMLDLSLHVPSSQSLKIGGKKTKGNINFQV